MVFRTSFIHTEPNYCKLHTGPYLCRQTASVFEFNTNDYQNSMLCFLCISSAEVSHLHLAMRGLQYYNFAFLFALFLRMLKRLANELTKKRSEQNKIEQWNDSVTDLWKRLEAHITINHPEAPIPAPYQAANIAPALPVRTGWNNA